jgi:hypothetical protein
MSNIFGMPSILGDVEAKFAATRKAADDAMKEVRQSRRDSETGKISKYQEPCYTPTWREEIANGKLTVTFW